MDRFQDRYNCSPGTRILVGPNWTSSPVWLTPTHLLGIEGSPHFTVPTILSPCGQFNRSLSIELKEQLDNDMALPFECLSSVSEQSDIDHCSNTKVRPEALVVNTNTNSYVGEDDFDISDWLADSTDYSTPSTTTTTLCDNNNYASSHSLLSNSSTDITSTSNCFAATAPLEDNYEPPILDFDIDNKICPAAHLDNFLNLNTDDLPLPILEIDEMILSPDSSEAKLLDEFLSEIEVVNLSEPIEPKPASRKRRLTLDIDKCHSAKRAALAEPSTADIREFDQLIGYLLPKESDDAVVSTTTPPCDVINEINWNKSQPLSSPPVVKKMPISSGYQFKSEIEREKRRRNNEASRRSRAIKKSRFSQMEEEIDELTIENKRMERTLMELDKAYNLAKQLVVSRISTR